jgi:hypothetical protein
MPIPAPLLFLAALAPAAAQPPAGLPTATLEALRAGFPAEHASLAASLAGKSPQEARRLVYAAIDKIVADRAEAILAAPGPTITGLEARQGALLRTLGRQDVRLCAIVGDRGFFSPEALAGPAPQGLDEYGAALIEAARAGAESKAATPTGPSREDYLAWLERVGKIEPDVPVRAMLTDREVRLASSPDHLCRGSAAMHEAAAALGGEAGERVARSLLRSVIAIRRN